MLVCQPSAGPSRLPFEAARPRAATASSWPAVHRIRSSPDCRARRCEWIEHRRSRKTWRPSGHLSRRKPDACSMSARSRKLSGHGWTGRWRGRRTIMDLVAGSPRGRGSEAPSTSTRPKDFFVVGSQSWAILRPAKRWCASGPVSTLSSPPTSGATCEARGSTPGDTPSACMFPCRTWTENPEWSR